MSPESGTNLGHSGHVELKIASLEYVSEFPLIQFMTWEFDNLIRRKGLGNRVGRGTNITR